MKIRELNILEFASLRERTFSFADGINLIEGANESGKSTLAAFIRFLLYGLPRKNAAGDANTTRLRALSWEGDVAAGSMTIETEKGLFRIERRGALRGARESYVETVAVYDESTGEKLPDDISPGDYFLGVNAAVYDSTAAIKQLETSRLSSAELLSSMENLLFSADESISTKKATELLEAERRDLLHKNKKGGRLYELEQRLLDLDTRLSLATTRAEECLSLQNRIDKLAEDCRAITIELREREETCLDMENEMALRRFETIHRYEEELSALADERARIEAELGFAPTGSHVEALYAMERELSAASAAEAEAARVRDIARASLRPLSERYRPMEALAETEDIQGLAEHAAALSRESDRQARRRRTAFTVGIVALLVGGALIPLSLLALTPLLPPLVGGGIGCALLAAGAIALGIGSRAGRTAAKAAADSAALLARFGLPETKIAILGDHIDRYLAEAAEAKRSRTDLSTAELALTECQDALTRRIEQIGRVLAALPLPFSPDAPQKSLRASIDRVRAALERYTAAQGRAEDLSGLARALTAELGDANEAALRFKLPPARREALRELNWERLRQYRDHTRERLRLQEQKRLALEKQCIELKAGLESPVKLSDEREAVSREAERARLRYDAVLMAVTALEGAGGHVRRHITPHMHRYTGELMSRLTAEKYSSVGIEADMSVNLLTPSGTKPIEGMSAGTRDMTYVALRLALIEVLFREEKPALILDEVFSQMDDSRAERLLRLLFTYGDEAHQCLLFTCHARERALLNKAEIPFHGIEL